MISPRTRAVRVVRWLQATAGVVSPEGKGWQELEDRIAEEIAEALEELREGFLRPPGARETGRLVTR
jgi:hypothetical protein